MKKMLVSLVFLAFVAEMSLGMPKEPVDGLLAKEFNGKGFKEEFPDFLNLQLTAPKTPSAPPHAYPHQISVQINNGQWVHLCGASIIHERIALTSANCALMCGDNQCRMVAGAHNLGVDEKTQQIRNVADIRTHPYFDSQTGDYDFGIIVPDTDFTFKNEVHAIELAYANYPSGNCISSGWGIGSQEGVLKHVNVTVVPYEDCKDIYGSALTERMVCVVCDCQDELLEYGGPMVCEGLLAGVGSWAHPPCGTKQNPAIFANVAKAFQQTQNWIPKPETF